MSLLEKHIDFKILTPDQFEELCFEIILRHGFSSVIWRQGGADNGRDIEAIFTSSNGIIGTFTEKYFFECKKYEKGVPPAEIFSKIAWADAEKPQHLVFFISSYLSNNAREWIDKIKRDKYYKVHIIEGKEFAGLVAQHDDIVSKYFITDKYTTLLNETVSKWVIHELTPNFNTFQYLLNHLEKQTLNVKYVVFLYTLYYVNYSSLEELENEIYYGVEIMPYIDELSEILKKKHNCNESVLTEEYNFETLSGEGFLDVDEDNISKFNYDFIACKASTKTEENGSFKLCYYLFRRLSETENIEILLYHNSSLEYKIRYSKNYKSVFYLEALDLLNLHGKYKDEVINLSLGMR